MASEEAIRGYLLEEALAWLLRGSGYRLLVECDDDPDELVGTGYDLRVRGRGADHQVDVLGELAFTPPFSLPLRLFLEAKFQGAPCPLRVVRNAHGVIEDVNENYVTGPGSRALQQRYRYVYALFSTSGFTADAEQYALAHQISLIDLSGPSFAWLLRAIEETATKLRRRQTRYKLEKFPVGWLRARTRGLLGTLHGATQQSAAPATSPDFGASATRVLQAFARTLRTHQAARLLLGFPNAPFILTLSVEDKQAFRAYAAQHPNHAVAIRRSREGGEWQLSPGADADAYQITFTMPQRVEEWITANEIERTERTRRVKAQLLSTITIYDAADGEDYLTYHLHYEPGALRRG